MLALTAGGAKWMFGFSNIKRSFSLFKNLDLSFNSDDQAWPIKSSLVIALALVMPYLLGYSLVTLII